MRRIDVRGLDVFDVPECLSCGSTYVRRRVERPEGLVTENLDPSVVQVEADVVGDVAQVLAVEQLDGIGVVVLPEFLHVFPGRVGETTGGDRYPPLGSVEVVGRDGRVQFLYGRPTHRVRVFTLDDDRSPGVFMNLLHEQVPAFVGGSFGLPDVSVPEVSEHVLHEVLEFEPGELVQYGHACRLPVSWECLFVDAVSDHILRWFSNIINTRPLSLRSSKRFLRY